MYLRSTFSKAVSGVFLMALFLGLYSPNFTHAATATTVTTVTTVTASQTELQEQYRDLLLKLVELLNKRIEQLRADAGGSTNTSATALAYIPTSPALHSGIKAKEKEFFASNPELPGTEKVTYEIENEELPSEATDADRAIWEIARALAPSDEVFSSLKEFVVYTDDEDDDDASMSQLDDNGDEWRFTLNYKVAENFGEMIPVVIHEFTHVLTLKNDQLTSETEDEDVVENCDTYLVDEGCFLKDAYLAEFFDKFYANNPDYQKGDREDTEAFFATRKDQYTTDYATTNPIEDIAEAFMYFASNDTITSETIKGQKVNFFNDYPELVEYRSEYRSTVMNWEN